MIPNEVIVELNELVQRIARRGSATSEETERIRQLANSMDYFRLYGGREGYEFKPRPFVGALRCSTKGCMNGLPFYNLNKMQGQPDHWVCLEHISSDIDFPIGLHGDDWVKTGRNKVVWGAGR